MAASARLRGAINGGFLLCWSFSGWARFSSTPTGPRFRTHYTYGPYISPFYSPEIWGDSPHAIRAQALLVSGLPAVFPGITILWIPGLFRFTCYYYRGAYYKSFWADPPACSVSEPRKSYLGERASL